MIDVIRYNSTANFGDDLNALLWPQVLPADVMAADDIALFGIGSIFAQKYADPKRLAAKRVFVFGSGAGYAPLPDDWTGWNIEAVRGPLTAKLVGLPSKGITDAAVLLASIPNLVPPAPRDEILYMPHFTSTFGGNWEKVCRHAGIRYVNPMGQPEEILNAFARAKLVVTEAMHGAIVADTLRIPWVPVASSGEILPFKWLDWCRSLNLRYEPRTIPPSSFWETIRQNKAVESANKQGIAVAFDTASMSDEALIADFGVRYAASQAPSTHGNGSSRLKLFVRGISSRLAFPFLEEAAQALTAAAKGPSYLSEERTFLDTLEQLVTARDSMVKKMRAG
ncbi:polysaccharide pyruvyl transferase family protein [Sphingomonas sp. PP-CC-3A-396]|uniref:polysaccharide pyruvyl transferase family protein n=1 Tax=Sphingomonas sp. PP-CC-3A-396 TaxID=2135655 RepID=UPI001051B1D0|nr:polysaccharide pyruvyl transferase family protein [Sphingomonas sp. PP-CC-3A-396]TCQ02116.1 succinoglycan biosynthesis protein ExoV [Sphingomonas sp. PP-CC-3A-396]